LAFLNFSVDGPFHAGFKDFRVRQYAAAEPAATVGIVTQLSHDATLNTLSISSGTLSPIFTATTTSYTAGVAYGVSSVTVIPTVNQANAIVTVNTVAVTSGQASAALPLTVGANTITVTVIAQDGTTTDTYTITINRAAPAVDATLSNLTISSGTLSPIFTATTTSYTAGVAYSVSSVTVTPTANQANAIITVNTVAVTSGQASAALPLTVGANTITVTVIAQDGITTKTYTITVNRAAPATDATLSNLTIISGSLTPAFAPATTAYADSVAYSVSSVTITPYVNQANATATVNTVAVISGQASGALTLNVGVNTITVTVTAQDGTTTKTYTISVTRSAPAVDATLSNLTISSGTLTPAFAAGTINYTDNLAAGVMSVTVTPFVNQINAAVKVNGTTVGSGQPSGILSLIAGANTIAIAVTAQDGVTTKTYTIIVTATAVANGGGGGGGGGVVAGTPVVTGITDVSSYINAKGLFTQNINVWSDDTDALIQIPSGTTVLLANGTMPTQISAIHMPTPPAFQPGAGIIGLAYDFTPAGITFSPAVTLRLSYNPGFLPTGVLENNLQIAYFDTTQNAWITVPATVDTVNHYISAQISHFTAYAVTYGVKQVTPAPTTTTSTTTTTTTVVPVVTTSSTTTTTTAPPTTTTTTTTTVAITTTLPTTTTTTVPVVTTETGTFVSADGKASVMIPSGSLGYTASGAAVTAITVTPVNNPPSVPDDIKGLGLYYEFGPTGATFSSPVSITLKYDPSAVPAGIDQSKLYIAYWDAGNNHWVSVPSVVDTVNHTITASVTHFTLYSAMAAAPSNATSAWVIAAIAVVSLVIIGFGTWIIIYRRRKTA
jgi:PKD repeat protein